MTATGIVDSMAEREASVGSPLGKTRSMVTLALLTSVLLIGLGCSSAVTQGAAPAVTPPSSAPGTTAAAAGSTIDGFADGTAGTVPGTTPSGTDVSSTEPATSSSSVTTTETTVAVSTTTTLAARPPTTTTSTKASPTTGAPNQTPSTQAQPQLPATTTTWNKSVGDAGSHTGWMAHAHLDSHTHASPSDLPGTACGAFTATEDGTAYVRVTRAVGIPPLGVQAGIVATPEYNVSLARVLPSVTDQYTLLGFQLASSVAAGHVFALRVIDFNPPTASPRPNYSIDLDLQVIVKAADGHETPLTCTAT
jgi:hypothetical protein